MTSQAETVPLSSELKALQKDWRDSKDRLAQDRIYAGEFGTLFAPEFARLPLHDAPAALQHHKPRVLISVLGLSWQPVALMAAWCQPERLVVVGSDKSLSMEVDGEDVLDLISRISRVPRSRMEGRRAGDLGGSDIYRIVRGVLRRTGAGPRETFIDPTGGKKSMSVAAALAGFLAGSLLVYVDYAEYASDGRIPVAGTEFPRLLHNPLEVFGDREYEHIVEAFNRGDYQRAADIAASLAQGLYEPREAEAMMTLARACAAWDQSRFHEAHEGILEVAESLKKFASHGRWSWAAAMEDQLKANAEFLEKLTAWPPEEKPESLEQAMPRLVWYLVKARRELKRGQTSLSVLLLYACVERFVDCCLWLQHGLDDEHPDYARIEGHLDRERYHAVGRLMYGKRYRAEDQLGGPVMYGNGLQLLATLSPELIEEDVLRPLLGLSNLRNKCEYQHGLSSTVPPTDRVEGCIKTVRRVLEHAAGRDLGGMMSQCRLPVLDLEAGHA